MSLIIVASKLQSKEEGLEVAGEAGREKMQGSQHITATCHAYCILLRLINNLDMLKRSFLAGEVCEDMSSFVKFWLEMCL